MKKCYLAGPVSGLDRELVIAAFDAAEVAMSKLGYLVVNPVRLVNERESWNDAMKVLIPQLCRCDVINLLPNWDKSIGAAFEYHTAVVCGLKVLGLTSNSEPNVSVVLEPIIKAAWGVDMEFLRQDTRRREVVELRQICMWYMDAICVTSQQLIAYYFGRTDHATVYHAVKMVNKLRFSDKKFGQKVEAFLKAA